MRIYITGSVGSGKSTLARRMSAITHIPCSHLDEVVYMEDPDDSWGNTKRPAEERDRLFAAILSMEHYIIEDAGRECFIEGMRQADTVVLLDVPLAVRLKRIMLRWLKQRLGLERCIYKPGIAVLRAMFRWARAYDKGIDGTKSRAALFDDKLIVLRGNKDTVKYIKHLHETKGYYVENCGAFNILGFMP